MLLGLAVDANETFANDLALASTREANELLAGEAPSRLRALAFADLARDLYTVNRLDEAAAANEQAIEMAVQVGDRRVEALARGRLQLAVSSRTTSARHGARWRSRLPSRARPATATSSLRVHECRLGARRRRGGCRAADLLVSEAIPMARELGLSTLAMAAWGAFYLWLAGRWTEGRGVLDEAARDDRVRSGRSDGLHSPRRCTTRRWAGSTGAEAALEPAAARRA